MKLQGFTGLTIFKTAFRIFFLAAAFHFVAALSVWLLTLNGISTGLKTSFAVQWHGFEMVFGFSRAVIIGFLFTAGQNWTGRVLLREGSLALVFLLWLAGRIAWFLPAIWSELFLLADVTANIIILIKLTDAFRPANQAHNRKIAVLWLLFTLAQFLAILGMKNLSFAEFTSGFLRNAVLMVLAFIIIIAGRILPFFAHRALPDIIPVQKDYLERLVIHGVYVVLAVDFAAIFLNDLQPFKFAIFSLFGLLNLLRWYYWGALKTWRRPILFVLFAGYFFMCLGFLLSLPPWQFYDLHVITLGAIALFILGMVTRVSLGHTGRVIHATVSVNISYILILAAMIVRVSFPYFDHASQGYIVSGSLSILAFCLYLLKYTKYLITPRPDHKPE